jgi:uncharacterized protein YqgV (UPF0045/DUF77 family)
MLKLAIVVASLASIGVAQAAEELQSRKLTAPGSPYMTDMEKAREFMKLDAIKQRQEDQIRALEAETADQQAKIDDLTAKKATRSDQLKSLETK